MRAERFALTKKEIRVLELVKRGAKYREIAAALFVSLKTVQTHVGNIHRKLELEPGIGLLPGLARKEHEDINAMIHARKDYDHIQDPDKRIRQDEPVMLFRARDVLAPALLAKYADLLRLHQSDPVMIQSVLAHEQRMRQWQRMNGCKLPDMPLTASREE